MLDVGCGVASAAILSPRAPISAGASSIILATQFTASGPAANRDIISGTEFGACRNGDGIGRFFCPQVFVPAGSYFLSVDIAEYIGAVAGIGSVRFQVLAGLSAVASYTAPVSIVDLPITLEEGDTLSFTVQAANRGYHASGFSLRAAA
ncbi:MAG: hypothetical protein AAF707_01605 [Pseudomonadota bacterium]